MRTARRSVMNRFNAVPNSTHTIAEIVPSVPKTVAIAIMLSGKSEIAA